jgi:hypothetical protein
MELTYFIFYDGISKIMEVSIFRLPEAADSSSSSSNSSDENNNISNNNNGNNNNNSHSNSSNNEGDIDEATVVNSVEDDKNTTCM